MKALDQAQNKKHVKVSRKRKDLKVNLIVKMFNVLIILKKKLNKILK